MEDLLKEEEFLAKKDDYNPWKGFVFFYGFVILFFILLYIIAGYIKTFGLGTEVNYVFFTFSLLAPFIIIFRKKKNILLPKRIIVAAVCIFTSLFFCLTLGIELIGDENYMMLGSAPLIIYLQLYAITFVYGLICSGIILLIRWIKLKKLKPQSSFL